MNKTYIKAEQGIDFQNFLDKVKMYLKIEARNEIDHKMPIERLRDMIESSHEHHKTS